MSWENVTHCYAKIWCFIWNFWDLNLKICSHRLYRCPPSELCFKSGRRQREKTSFCSTLWKSHTCAVPKFVPWDPIGKFIAVKYEVGTNCFLCVWRHKVRQRFVYMIEPCVCVCVDVFVWKGNGQWMTDLEFLARCFLLFVSGKLPGVLLYKRRHQRPADTVIHFTDNEMLMKCTLNHWM